MPDPIDLDTCAHVARDLDRDGPRTYADADGATVIRRLMAEVERLRLVEQRHRELVAAVDRHVSGTVQNTGHRDMPPGVWFYHTFEFSKRHWPTRAEAEAAYRERTGLHTKPEDERTGD